MIVLGRQRCTLKIFSFKKILFFFFVPNFRAVSVFSKNRQRAQFYPISMDVFLLIVVLIIAFALLAVNVYILIYFQHPDDNNTAYFPKLLVVRRFAFKNQRTCLISLHRFLVFSWLKLASFCFHWMSYVS